MMGWAKQWVQLLNNTFQMLLKALLEETTFFKWNCIHNTHTGWFQSSQIRFLCVLRAKCIGLHTGYCDKIVHFSPHYICTHKSSFVYLSQVHTILYVKVKLNFDDFLRESLSKNTMQTTVLENVDLINPLPALT
jgi:hypothetical protein